MIVHLWTILQQYPECWANKKIWFKII